MSRLDPINIRFTQDSIGGQFTDGRKLEDTFKELLYGRLSVDEIESIEVINQDSSWWATMGNRRLYIYQKLRRLGIISSIPVTHMHWTPVNSANEGQTIKHIILHIIKCITHNFRIVDEFCFRIIILNKLKINICLWNSFSLGSRIALVILIIDIKINNSNNNLDFCSTSAIMLNCIFVLVLGITSTESGSPTSALIIR